MTSSDGNPLVSVVVPAYNAGAYLGELCRSLQQQTYPNFEALILDDGSTDDTLAVAETFRQDSRFRISGWSANRGVSAATVELLGQVRGEYWCHPGADDVLEPAFIERRLSVLSANPAAMLVHGPAENIDESGGPRADISPPLKLPAEIPGEGLLPVLLQHNIINTPSVLVRTAATRKVLPLFAGHWRYAQDWYLWLLHAALGQAVLWHNERLHKYRIHTRSLTQDPARSAWRDAEIRLVPLCALQAAATLSPAAADLWRAWRGPLYALWLRRAAKLRRDGRLQTDWLMLGAQAYHGQARPAGQAQLNGEIFRHAPAIIQATWREQSARKRQAFAVSGLAQINDPLFLRPQPSSPPPG